MTFVVLPIPLPQLDDLRRGGVDDRGERLRPFVADEDGAQLRCCLRESRAGERLALMAYRPPGTAGAYQEIGPVFIHADPCGGYSAQDGYPTAFRSRRQVFRAYDFSGRITDAILVEGGDVEADIERLLSRPDVATIHSRNVLYGCYLFTIDPRKSELTTVAWASAGTARRS